MATASSDRICRHRRSALARALGLLAAVALVGPWVGCTADNPDYVAPGADLGGNVQDLQAPTDLAPVADLANPPDMGPCGATDQPCCSGTCQDGNVCSWGVCRACGGAYQLCCPTTPACSTDLVCANNRCYPCGGNYQPCCSNGECPTSTRHQCTTNNYCR